MGGRRSDEYNFLSGEPGSNQQKQKAKPFHRLAVLNEFSVQEESHSHTPPTPRATRPLLRHTRQRCLFCARNTLSWQRSPVVPSCAPSRLKYPPPCGRLPAWQKKLNSSPAT